LFFARAFVVREEFGLIVGEVVLVQREGAIDLECDEISDKRLGSLGALVNNLVAHKPYEPSGGFFAVRTIWLMAHITYETVFHLIILAFILAMYHL
jgi:hypothetical protein